MSDAVGLTIQDIANAVSIIDILVKRGTIEGSEMTPIGSVRDKLAAFVEANKDNADAETNTQEGPV